MCLLTSVHTHTLDDFIQSHRGREILPHFPLQPNTFFLNQQRVEPAAFSACTPGSLPGRPTVRPLSPVSHEDCTYQVLSRAILKAILSLTFHTQYIVKTVGSTAQIHADNDFISPLIATTLFPDTPNYYRMVTTPRLGKTVFKHKNTITEIGKQNRRHEK